MWSERGVEGMLKMPVKFLLNDRSQSEADRYQAPSKPTQVGRIPEVRRRRERSQGPIQKLAFSLPNAAEP